MSFFIKGKGAQKNTKRFASKYKQPAKKRKVQAVQEQKSKNVDDDEEEISSDSEDDIRSTGTVSEEDVETAQEKKLRLAKIYLEEIERQERERLENKEELNQHEDVIAKRLKDDYLKQKGKLRTTLADQYSGVDEANLKTLKCREHKSCITTLCVSSDSKYVFTGSKCGSIVKWDIEEGKKLAKIPFSKSKTKNGSKVITNHNAGITCLCISFDSKFLAASDESNDIQIWDPNNLEHKGTLSGHKNTVLGVVFRQQTHTLYSSSKDRSVKVWSVDDMAYVETLYGHQDSIGCIDALIRERAITAGGFDGTIRVWKITEESQLIYNGTGCIDVVKLVNEENFISGGDEGALNVWSALKKKPIASVKNAHGIDESSNMPNWISALATLKNSDLIASGSCDGLVRLWKLSNNFRKIEKLFEIPVNGFVNSLEFTNDGNHLLIGLGREHRLGRWQVIKSAKANLLIVPLLKNK